MAIRRFVLIAFAILLLGHSVHTQQPTVKPIKVPAERATQLKQLEDRFKALQQEMEKLQAQWVIVSQRAALEAGLSAAQVDAMVLGPAPDGGFQWEARKEPTPAATPKPTP